MAFGEAGNPYLTFFLIISRYFSFAKIKYRQYFTSRSSLSLFKTKFKKERRRGERQAQKTLINTLDKINAVFKSDQLEGPSIKDKGQETAGETIFCQTHFHPIRFTRIQCV